MRIHRLSLTGIGPFRHPQVVDFETLNAAGLFLVDGPTGAGKSSLIDAIVFALFGTVAGSHSDAGRIRSDHSLPDEPSEVVLEFTVQGRRHRVTRSPAYKRPKLRGEGLTEAKAAQVLEEFDPDGNVRASLTAADEIGRHVRDLLGMSADQFRQLVVLPQGEFDALLRMRPAERLAALADLLGTEFFERLQAELVAGAASARAARAEADAAVSAAVSRIEGAIRGSGTEAGEDDSQWLTIVGDGRASDGERLAAVCESAERTQLAKDSANALMVQLTFDLARCEEEARRAAQLWDAARGLAHAHERLTNAIEELDPADATCVDAPSERVGELRQWLGAVQDMAEWEDDAPRRLLDRNQLLERSSAASSDERRARTALDTLPARREELLAMQERSRTAHAEHDRLRADATAIIARLEVVRARDASAARLAIADAEAHALQSAADAALGAVAAARACLDGLRVRHAAQAASLLAAALEDGCACPVCGSVEHPSAAQVDESELVHAGDLEEAESQLEREESAYASAVAAVAESADAAADVRREFDRLSGAAGEDDEAHLVAGEQAVVEEMAELAQDLVDLDNLAGQLVELEEEARTGADAVSQAQHAAQRAAFEVEQFDRAEATALAGIADLVRRAQESLGGLDDVGTACELLHLLGRRGTAVEAVATASADVRLARAAADASDLGKGVPDIAVLAENAAASRTAAEKAAAARDEQASRLGRLEHRHSALGRGIEELGELFDARESTVAGTNAVIGLADLVTAARGSSNAKRVSLESYAIQRRFSSVLEAASLHLERMSAGKYALELDDTARGNQQAGLGISVLDAWTGRARDPRTLSGGESFYVSLALALGLADVVRDESGGVPIETLFVDEGFGALDQDTLGLVLEQLDHLRSGGRVIGLVSHVTEMKEWLSDRIEVSVGPDRTSMVRVLPEGASSAGE